MSSQEELKFQVVTKVWTGKLRREDGANILNVSDRTLRRYLKNYEKKGVRFVKHGNFGKTPVNKTDPTLKEEIMSLVREKYFDCNMTHSLELLQEQENLEVNRETFRRWCHEIQMVKRAKKKRGVARRKRQRMKQEGLMLQFDGSPHRWFGHEETCLILGIDDASSDVPYGEFFPGETTLGCMQVLKNIIERKGLFEVLYTDRAGIFAGHKRQRFSQVKRALGELGIQVIYASSPEAKGRVENLFGTLQDRLIPEMRLADVQTTSEANAFLNENYLPNRHNKKFRVQPFSQISAYRPVPPHLDLNEIFCLKDHRRVARDHTFSWKGKFYLLHLPDQVSIHKQKIEIRTYPDCSWSVFYRNQELRIEKIHEPLKASELPDDTMDIIAV